MNKNALHCCLCELFSPPKGLTGVSQTISWCLTLIWEKCYWSHSGRLSCCTYPLQQALPRWLDNGRLQTLSRSSCWLRSWSWTRTPLRARRSRTLAFWKTSSSFTFCQSGHQIQSLFGGKLTTQSNLTRLCPTSPIYLSDIFSSPACSTSGSSRGTTSCRVIRHVSAVNVQASRWGDTTPSVSQSSYKWQHPLTMVKKQKQWYVR